jgi:hypothetical protein
MAYHTGSATASPAAALVLLFAFVDGANAQIVREPAWPQPFRIVEGQSVGFGFIVTQPGPIVVTATSQGAPIVVRVSGPATQILQQAGSGAVKVAYTATAADVQKSSIWLVRIAAASGTQPPKGSLPRTVATGTVRVEHPFGNPSIAAAELQRRLSAPAQRTPVKAALNASALSAAYAQQVASRQAAQLQQLMKSVATTARTSASAELKAQVPRLQSGPRITTVSAGKGEPGDPILITGSGLGGAEIHFVVNPGMDLKATTDGVTSDTHLTTWVPTVTGVGGYHGQVYVQVSGVKSPSIAFDFVPTLEWVDLHPTSDDPDARIDPTDHNQQFCSDAVCHDGVYDLSSHNGDDIFYATKVLKNGWVVHEANAGGTGTTLFSTSTCARGECGDAYVTDSRVGTAYPYVKVHWWMNALAGVGLNAVVIIKGPKGLPYQ